MKIYIIWSEQINNSETNIIGIYKSKKNALKRCNAHNKKIDINY